MPENKRLRGGFVSATMVKLWSTDGTKLVSEVSTLPYKHWPDILLWGSRHFVKTEDQPNEPTPKYCERFCGIVGIYEDMAAPPSDNLSDLHPPSDYSCPPGNPDAELEMLKDPGSFAKATTDGNPPADGNWDKPAPQSVDGAEETKGQHKAYWVLPEEERAKGFVRPVRQSYIHVGPKPPGELRDLTAEEQELYAEEGYVKFEDYPHDPESSATGRFWTRAQLDSVGGCGSLTTMTYDLAETYARNPKYYGATFCFACDAHFPVGAKGEFVWDNSGPKGQVFVDKVDYSAWERVGT